jgi:DNA helicase-4
MQFSPHPLGRLLHLCPSYTLSRLDGVWQLSQKGHVHTLDFAQSEFSVQKKQGFYQLQIGSHVLGGLTAKDTGLFLQQSLVPIVEQLYRDFSDFWEQPHYLREHQRRSIIQILLVWADRLEHITQLEQWSESLVIIPELFERAKIMLDFARDSVSKVQQRNEAFVHAEMAEFKDLFDRVEKLPLTPEQQSASVLFEENNLLIAAAGSGKSSALVGKVGYALQKGMYEAEEILALAFNTAAADELSERLHTRLGEIGTKVKAKTFHSLGVEVLKSAGLMGEIEDESAQAKRLDRVITNLQVTSPEFQKNWHFLCLIAPIAAPNPDAFRTEEDYQKTVANKMRLKTHAQGFPTLSGQTVRSFEEIAIANWLWLHGVEFEYEKPYEAGMLRMGWNKYSPDFYLVKEGVYFEHFALDANGKAPLFMGDKQDFYAEQAKVKQKLLKELNFRQFWTTSGEYRQGILFEKLEKHLLDLGYDLQTRNKAQIDQALQMKSQKELLDLVKRGVSLIRGNGTQLEELLAKLEAQPDPLRAQCYIQLIWEVATEYGKSLQEDGKMDFDSMIGTALQALADGKAKLPYRFILADEFQDISIGRARLVQEVLKSKENTALFCVGDDWQAINRFAGSDLALFTQFDHHFGPSQSSYLTKTFRCNQGIATMSANFVMANPEQVKKKVFAHDARTDEVCRIWECNNEQDYLNRIHEELVRWAGIQAEKSKKGKVYFLSRYGPEKTFALTVPQLKKWASEFSEHLDLEMLTMHKSKGLESEYVVLLGIHSKMSHGFPGRQDDEPLLSLILPDEGAMPFADDRRLFYVAITRAKTEVSIPFIKEKASPFLYELVAQERQGSLLWNGQRHLPKRCPECKKGILLKIAKKDGSYFWRCSQEKELCKASFSTEPSDCPKCGEGLLVKKFVNQQYVQKCTEGC